MTKTIDWETVDREIGREAAVELVTKVKRGSRLSLKLWIIEFAIFVGIIILLATGCASNRATFTTLASTEQAVKLSYDGYVDSVIKGQTHTNELSTIAKSFDAFQSSFRVAVDKASGDTNAPVTGDLSAAAAAILNAITTAKSQPK